MKSKLAGTLLALSNVPLGVNWCILKGNKKYTVLGFEY